MAGWSIQGGFTRMATRTSDGMLIKTDRPRDLFKLFTTWTPGKLRQLTVGGGVSWQSIMYDFEVPEGPLRDIYSQPGHGVVDLMARYDFSKKLSVSLNLNNAFDKIYRTSLYDHSYGAPRNFNATLKYAF